MLSLIFKMCIKVLQEEINYRLIGWCYKEWFYFLVSHSNGRSKAWEGHGAIVVERLIRLMLGFLPAVAYSAVLLARFHTCFLFFFFFM